MRQRMIRIAESVLLRAGLAGCCLALRAAALGDRRLRSSISSFEAIYSFRVDSSACSLIFSKGRIRSTVGSVGEADFEVVFLDLPGAVRQLLREPQDVLRLVATNKIEQVGNLFYLFRLGYLLGLCRCALRRLIPGSAGLGTAARSAASRRISPPHPA